MTPVPTAFRRKKKIRLRLRLYRNRQINGGRVKDEDGLDESSDDERRRSLCLQVFV